MTPEFKNAKLYSCKDDEFVIHDSWDQAIFEMFEDVDAEIDETIEQLCERIGPVTVDAYREQPAPQSWVDRKLNEFMDRFEESFGEEFGCEDHDAQAWTEETRAWAKTVLTANLTKSLRSATTFSIEKVGSHTFSVAECIEMMK